MRRHVLGLLALASFIAFSVISVFAAEPKLNTQKIEELTGLRGQFNEKEGVFKVSLPRKDLSITIRGVKMSPAMGLTAWAAFAQAGSRAAVMGDIVLLEEQVNPVMSVALDNGLEVTALHNHFFGDSPKVMFMHISGIGNEEALASAVGKVFRKLQETHKIGQPKPPYAVIDPARTSLDPKKIDGILGRSGELKDGVYKITIGRETEMHGHKMGNAMGVNTWAAFAGNDDKAVVDGDFAMLESELQNVLKALRGADIDIVAIHNHMTMESPRIVFLHFWGVGTTTNLARGLKAALDTQNLR